MPANAPKPGESLHKIDLNHASRDELMQIPGVSRETADELIKSRDEQLPGQKGERTAWEQRAASRERDEDELVDRLYV